MVPMASDTALGVVSLQWGPWAHSMPSTGQTVRTKLLVDANLMKFHQIQHIDVSTGRKHPDGAQAQRVAAPYIASTDPAVSPSADTHRWLSSIESSLGAHAVTGAAARLDLRPHRAPVQPPPPASRRQRHSTASYHGGRVKEAMPVASVWLS